MTVLTILERGTNNVIDTFSNESKDSNPFTENFSGGGVTDSLELGVATYNVTFYKKYIETNAIVRGNQILMQDKKGIKRAFFILQTEEDSYEITAYCVDVNLSLNNEITGEYEAQTQMTIAQYINYFLPNFSRYEIGINEIPNLSRKLKWEGNDTLSKRIRSIATQFDNAYIAFRVELVNGTIYKRYIDIYKSRGKNTGLTLEVGKELANIEKREDLSTLATALKGVGGTIENSDPQENVTIKSINYDDGRYFSPINDDKLYDRLTGDYWRELEPNMGATDGFITKVYSYDTQSPSELLNRMLAEFNDRKVNYPTVEYTVNMTFLPDSIGLGDTIRIVDHDYSPPLYLEADVQEINLKHDVNGEDSVILGNFVTRLSKIEQSLLDLQNQLNNVTLTAFYPWVRYADDDQGNGFSASPVGKTYIAIKNVKNQPVPSENPADYFGLWTRFLGENGLPGADGQPKFTWIRYADTASGSGISPDPTGKMFIGFAYNRDTEVASENPSDYNWSAMYDVEKLNELIDTVNSFAVPVSQPDPPLNPVNGQLWWQTAPNDPQELLGYFKWDGNSWIPQVIQQGVLNVVDLNAVNMTACDFIGGTISGSQFSNVYEYDDPWSLNTTIQGNLVIKGAIENNWKVKNSDQNGNFVLQPTGIASQSWTDLGKSIKAWQWFLGNSGLDVSTKEPGQTGYARSIYTDSGIQVSNNSRTTNLRYNNIDDFEIVSNVGRVNLVGTIVISESDQFFGSLSKGRQSYRPVRASAFEQQSERKHKRNIKPLSKKGSYIDDFKKINFVGYRWNAEKGRYQEGVIYDETINKPFAQNGGIDVQSYATYIGKALQDSLFIDEVRDEVIDSQELRINELEQKNAELEKKINEIMSKIK